VTTTTIQTSNEGMATPDAPSCLLCGSVGTPLHPAPRDRGFGAPGVRRMVECRRCDFAWLDPRPTPIDMGKVYATRHTPNSSSVGLRRFGSDWRGPEAEQRVLQAGAFGDRDEVFGLEMGEPERIFDVAQDLIRLSGREPGADIEVHVTDIRPWEKRYEELSSKGAHVVPTDHPKILRACDAEAGDASENAIAALIDAARENWSAGCIRRLLSAMVPEYHGPPDSGEFEMVSDADTCSADEPFEQVGSGAAQLQMVRSVQRALG